MVADGFEHGEAGLRRFSETYGVLEKVTVIEPQDNACSEARVSKRSAPPGSLAAPVRTLPDGDERVPIG
jgi:hypothetical protein